MGRLLDEDDVIDAIKNCECMHIFELSEVIPKINALPDVRMATGACWGCQCEKVEKPQPEHNTGYIDIRIISMVDGEDCFCSECGAYCLSTAYKFCPKCGIKFIGVRGEQDEINRC